MIAFDAQTSGGLLMSVPGIKAESVIKDLKSAGFTDASAVGEVVGRKEKYLYLTC